MRRVLRALIGADRPKVIVVFGSTRAEVERSVRHARSGTELPVWAYCAEPAIPLDECVRFVSGTSPCGFLRELGSVWVALSVVAWTGGHRGLLPKLLPFLLPPFRILVLNEAGGFFPARPAAIAAHARRRMRDACVAGARRPADWTRGSVAWAFSIVHRSGEKARDVAGLAHSLLFRGGERTIDGLRLAWSLAYRFGEFVTDAAGLAHSLAYRGGERTMDIVRLAYSLLYRGVERIPALCDWAGEFSLAILAALAGWTSRPSRLALTRLRRRMPLKLTYAAPLPDVVEILIPGRAWRRRTVMRAIAASGAEFVVFRRAGEDASVGPLIRMARETDAFAVARQLGYAAWRKKVVVKHPFRQLQEGEVSEVFAPFSSLVVIRRDLLLKLGCPRAFTFGAALMLLFWKASAAGLRSLAMGHEGCVTDEPAMALEDAELALRVTLSRSLSKLGPLHPDRFRGNVAWSPDHVRGFRGKRRVLVVSPYLPFPLSHGGAVRIYNLCREMSDDIDFVLATFRESGEIVRYPELHEVFREVYVVDADEKHLDGGVPKQVAEYRNGAMSDLIRRFCLQRRIDLVQLEYTQLAEYRDDTGAVPVLLVEHDITFTLYRQLAGLTNAISAFGEYQRWLAFEREALQCSNAVWTMSVQDRKIAVGHGSARNRTHVVPNGVDLARFRPEVRSSGPSTVLFVGSFRHLPNLLAFEVLRETVMPAVWQRCPEAILQVIAGPHHERAAEVAGKRALLEPDSRIRMEGFVEDVRPFYRDCDLVAIPLPVSAGTNIKLMEAMACGRAVVSTPAGCAGLNLEDGREIVVEESWSRFAEAMVGLLANGSARSGIAAEARRTAERRFGWDAIAREALESYAALTGDTYIDRVRSV